MTVVSVVTVVPVTAALTAAPEDGLGNAHSHDAADSRAAITAFVHGFLANEPSVLQLLAPAERDFGVLLQSYAAMLQLFAETKEAVANAAPHLRRALDPATPALPRERQFAAAVAAWAEGAIDRAQDQLEALLAAHPRDLVALKLAQILAFSQGDAPRMLRQALACRAAEDNPFWQGMTAFAYEQCHRLGEAEWHARQALALRPREPWALHALAHVMLVQGRFAEGRAVLAAEGPHWVGLNSFMRTHLWWHLALFEIELGDNAAALRLYDREVWGVDKSYSQDQIGAVSLLTRLELAGQDVGAARWAELGGFLAARREDHVEPFLSLQYLLGLARAGRPEAAALLAHLRDYAPRAPAATRAAWQDLALPAGEGLLAFAAGDAETAQRLLGRALPRLAEIGGSHAQRDLFDQVYIEALLRSGRRSAAHQLLQTRLNATPASRRLARQLARLDAALGLPAPPSTI